MEKLLTQQQLVDVANGATTSPLTEDERSWCMKEIQKFSDIGYDTEELVPMNDKDLASLVLTSWMEYVQSKL